MRKFGVGHDFDVISIDGEAYRVKIKDEDNSTVNLADKGMGSIQLMILLLRLATILREYEPQNIVALEESDQLRYPTIIIEEPEQNLFPQTQLDLMEDIISCCNNERHPSVAIITTHSPYVLSAINILMFAGKLVTMGVNPEEFSDTVPSNCIIAPEEVEVYAVKDGTCHSIKEPNTGLINQNDLDSASEYNASLFDRLYRLYVSRIQGV
jgi:hypothetical protein